ncbi:MAG: PilZ domain-containing protein [Desulfuromonadales bacterium]
MLENLPHDRWDRSLPISGLPDNVLPFFHCLVGEWGYDVQRHRDRLVLVKTGHDRIPKTPSQDPLNLGASADVATLWSMIESRFHAAARRHIRLKRDIPAELIFYDTATQSRFVSISDAGGRLIFPHELVRGERGHVRFCMGKQPFETRCEVIYVLPKREWEERSGIDVGVVFRWPDRQQPLQARQCITRHYLDRVASMISEEDYCSGLEYFQTQDLPGR